MSASPETPAVWQSSFEHPRLGLVTCQAGENGLTGVSFGPPGSARAAGFPPAGDAPAEAARVLGAAVDQLRAYLARELQVFDLPLDLGVCSAFQRQVLAEICKIPYGQVITYGQIAQTVGGMKHVRAVGGAVGANPLPIVIPCHRVVSTGGQMRGYTGWGGIRTKTWLLQLEGQRLIADEMD